MRFTPAATTAFAALTSLCAALPTSAGGSGLVTAAVDLGPRAGNDIADSAAGLANSIQGGNGGDIADSALGLASSIVGSIFNKKEN
ncbi:hypothetical protein ISF_01735 [Cordyceps fumosorosea ARSEF 2679]|uniref:Uncharacterized protein n=1 Tax=Cordyceps fumosorosea (strain ARSEF 2679) TaxID=1081104 RepID=A0A162LIZ4_CORFA|nr:hypothetical protein ISF_01735 [Cordyceps fumosorosea ARSEF 2679]OAA71184.1 hypothetical protein ISF_01735 [Cordyceps fumosorosea ARSEF 2679]